MLERGIASRLLESFGRFRVAVVPLARAPGKENRFGFETVHIGFF
jgi:hypothetical protein